MLQGIIDALEKVQEPSEPEIDEKPEVDEEDDKKPETDVEKPDVETSKPEVKPEDDTSDVEKLPTTGDLAILPILALISIIAGLWVLVKKRRNDA